MGHAVPEKALRLEQWIEAYGPLSHPWRDADDMTSRKTDYQKAYEEAVALPDAGRSAKALRSLLEDPRLVVVCGDSTVKAIKAKADELTKKDPAALAELQAEEELSSILWKEWSMHTLDDTRLILNGLKQLGASYPDTRYGDYAEGFYKRLMPSYEAALKQVEQMKIELQKQQEQKVKAKTGSRSRIPLMRKEGNHVSFE